MSEVVYRRIYTYKGQNSTSAYRSVSLSSFSVSGDTEHTIERIKSIRYDHYHSSTNKPTWSLSGRLLLDDDSYVDSTPIAKKFNNDVLLFTNYWETLPTKEQFARITHVQTVARGTAGQVPGIESRLYWRATSDYPMRLIVDFYDTPLVKHIPKVEKLTALRTTATGELNDEGTRIRATVKLSLANPADAGISSAKLHYATGDEVTTASPSVTFTTEQITQALAGDLNVIIPGEYTPGMNCRLLMVFSCGTEEAQSVFEVPFAKATLHMSGCKSGGVAVGKFSSSTEGNPLFECAIPAQFQSDLLPTETLRPDMASGIATPGQYGGRLTLRRIGNLVIVTGSVRCTRSMSSGTICELPPDFTPYTDVFALQTIAGAFIVRLIAAPAEVEGGNGRLWFEWTKSIETGGTISHDWSWIACDMVYWAKEV